jgi:hypothetical protein
MDDVPVAPMLQPFLSPSRHPQGSTAWDRRFDRYGSVASSLFELTPIADADVVVLPGDWYWVRGTSWRSRPDRRLTEMVRPLYEKAVGLGKPVVMFFSGDRSCDRVPFQEAHVFREGPFASRSGPLDHSMPAFSEDLVEQYSGGTMVERPKRDRPVIGFCGLAGSKPLWRRAGGQLAYHPVVLAREGRVDPSPYLGEVLRSRAVRLLEQCDDVDTNFILRTSKVFFRSGESRDLLDVRSEYVQNLAESDYVLCIRGSGNYSYRLYEAMCMGRIPVVVNTDLALPFEDEIAWKHLTVWVEQDEISSLPDRLHDFHSRLSPTEFIELQHSLRQHWLDDLCPQGFFARFSEIEASALRQLSSS